MFCSKICFFCQAVKLIFTFCLKHICLTKQFIFAETDTSIGLLCHWKFNYFGKLEFFSGIWKSKHFFKERMRGSLRRREIFVRVQGKDDATCIPFQQSLFTLKTVFFLKIPFKQNITLLWFSTGVEKRQKKWLHSHRCLAVSKKCLGHLN